MHLKCTTSSHCTLAVFIFVTMVTVSIATPVRIRYDQRQDGEYNFATHVKKVVVMVPSDIKTEFDLSDLDFDDFKSLSQKKPGVSQPGQGVSQHGQGVSQHGQGVSQSIEKNMKLVSSLKHVK
uniref:Uncharacterized protein n=1 Tax=Cacopsylla melanoneura TaxID=428564 RepID=A0A8D8Z9E5_9HEMI